MSKTGSMYAGSSGSNYGVNKNHPGNGNNKWQGVLSSVGHGGGNNARSINSRASSTEESRTAVFYFNALGGVGKLSTMYASTADGVKSQ